MPLRLTNNTSKPSFGDQYITVDLVQLSLWRPVLYLHVYEGWSLICTSTVSFNHTTTCAYGLVHEYKQRLRYMFTFLRQRLL